MILPPNLKNSGAFSPWARERFRNFISATIFLLRNRVLGLIFTSSKSSFSDSVKILERRSKCSYFT
jgi:hypothetical protein